MKKEREEEPLSSRNEWDLLGACRVARMIDGFDVQDSNRSCTQELASLKIRHPSEMTPEENIRWYLDLSARIG